MKTPDKATTRIDGKLFASIVTAMENAIDEEGNKLNMSSVMVSQAGDAFVHHFKGEDTADDLRSISKPVLCLTLGIAMEHGLELSGKKLTLDTLIWPFFEKKIRLVNSSNKARLERVQLRHLLNHTTGHEEGLMFRDQIKNKNPDTLLDYVFNYDLTHDPGEHFAYSNAGPYIISALIHETLGINLSSWVSQLLLEPLEITRHEWKNYGKYCAAATGLKLFQTDLHKIGHLFLDNGRYKAQQVVPEHWIELMRTPNIKTSALYDETEPFPKYAYGYYMWICKGENYFCYGTDGQYLIVLPGSGIVITTLGQQTDMRPIAECFRVLL